MTKGTAFRRAARAGVLAAMTAALAAGPVSAHPDPNDPATAHFLSNEAVLVIAGETKILFDPLFTTSYGYPLIADEVRAQIFAGEAPYDGVDAVFVSHAHGDHFDAADMNRYLAAHEDVAAFLPPEAYAALQEDAGWRAAFADRIQVTDLALGESAEPVDITLADGGVLHIEARPVPHAGDEAMERIVNLAYRVTLNGEATVMHLGDATPDRAALDVHQGFFDARRTHRAFPPYWVLQELGEAEAGARLNADTLTGIHVAIEHPDWLEGRDYDVFIQPGETRSVGPEAHSHEE